MENSELESGEVGSRTDWDCPESDEKREQERRSTGRVLDNEHTVTVESELSSAMREESRDAGEERARLEKGGIVEIWNETIKKAEGYRK